MKNKLDNKWFYFPVVLFFIYFIYRLLDFSKIVSRFPLDKTNDIASYIAQLYFLSNYGFHQLVPHWGGGFTLFQTYPPGWFYFTLPLYNLFNDYLVATFISTVLIMGIIFFAIVYFGKLNNLSFTRRLAFFIFLFANPISIGNFTRLGRVTELFGWMNFIILALIFLYYLEKELNIKFYILFIAFYSVLMLSHPAIIVVFPLLLIGFFFSRKLWKERIIFVVSSLLVYFITSFWWIGFVSNLEKGGSVITKGLLSFSNAWFWTNVAGFVIIPALWISFYFHWKNFKNKKHLIFIMPVLIVSVLFISRLIVFTPFLNKVFPDIYLMLFLFFALYYFLKVRNFYSLNSLIKVGLIVLAVVSVFVSFTSTPLMKEYSDVGNEAVDLIDKVEGKFFVFGFPGSGFDDIGGWYPGNDIDVYAVYSYATVCCDLISATHVMFSGGSTVAERRFFFDTMRKGNNGECKEFKENLDVLEVDEFLTFQDHCEVMLSCGFELKEQNGDSCLFFN
ncbi:MAG: hypothetical protein CMH62_02520 [Nanoarchaeota archaeon]|nr:hypothetical protein [Nanoarchaeota archaeon]|tara:strand:- start:485 stop:1996 length:1512 start_codon:yes stop_codon:yes gene_type:complete